MLVAPLIVALMAAPGPSQAEVHMDKLSVKAQGLAAQVNNELKRQKATALGEARALEQQVLEPMFMDITDSRFQSAQVIFEVFSQLESQGLLTENESFIKGALGTYLQRGMDEPIGAALKDFYLQNRKSEDTENLLFDFSAAGLVQRAEILLTTDVKYSRTQISDPLSGRSMSPRNYLIREYEKYGIKITR